MKNMIRAAVVVLALTGASASFHVSAGAQQPSTRVVAAKASAFPVPTCPPDDPNGCGISGN